MYTEEIESSRRMFFVVNLIWNLQQFAPGIFIDTVMDPIITVRGQIYLEFALFLNM